MNTYKILKNKLIKKALDNFVPIRKNYSIRVRDTQPLNKLTKELNIARHPVHGLKVQLGTRLIEKIRKELGVKNGN